MSETHEDIVGILPPGENPPTGLRERILAVRAKENEYQLRCQLAELSQRLRSFGCLPSDVDMVLSNRFERWYPVLKAEEWETKIADKRELMILLGGNQVGKTLAAVWLMSRRMMQRPGRGIHVPGDVDEFGERVWVPWSEYDGSQAYVNANRLINARANDFSPEGRQLWMQLTAARFLVIDELGLEFGPVDKPLTRILQDRIGGRLPTVLISNKTRVEFAAAYGDRIVSRADTHGMLLDVGDQGSTQQEIPLG